MEAFSGVGDDLPLLRKQGQVKDERSVVNLGDGSTGSQMGK
jgi:hypothetical protein